MEQASWSDESPVKQYDFQSDLNKILNEEEAHAK
jgi:hypothetical protein